MATRTIANAGGNWGTAATWVEGAVPTAADDVVATATSGNLTIAAAAVCRSINLTNYVGTLKHEAFTLTVGTTTAPPESKALVFPVGMTYTAVSLTAKILFSSSIASVTHTVDFNGKAVGSTEFSATGTGSGYKLLSGFTAVATNVVFSVTRGVFNANGLDFTVGIFSVTGSGTRGFKGGSSTITVSGSGEVFAANARTNLTWEPETSTFKFTGTAALTIVGMTALAMNNVEVTAVTGSLGISSGEGGTWANLSITTAASGNNAVTISVAAMTISGKLTLTGVSALVRLFFKNNVNGTQQAITAKETSLANVDFEDTKALGEATWTGTSIGNCQGNSGITFTTPVTRYAVVAGLFSSTATWSATSGGAGGASVPLPQDTIILNASSGAGTYSNDRPRVGTIDCTGFTRTLNMTVEHFIYGDITLGTAGTYGIANTKVMRGRGEQTIKTNGKEMTPLVIEAPGGTYKLLDNCLAAGRACTITRGTLNINGKTAQFSAMNSNSSNVRGILLPAGSKWVSDSTFAGSVWNIETTTNLTFEMDATATIEVGASVATNIRVFRAASKTYAGKLIIPAGGTGPIEFTGNPTFGELEVKGGPKTLIFPAGSVITITEALIATGSTGNLIVFESKTAGSAFKIKKVEGIVSLDWVSLKDSTAEGGATFYAGANSTNVSNNTGWNFTAAAKTVEANQTTEADIAQAIQAIRTKITGQAIATEIAQPIKAIRVKPVGQVIEVNTAQPVTVKVPKVVAVGQAKETDQVQHIAANENHPVTQPIEAETAQPINAIKTRAVGLVSSPNLAQSVAAQRIRAIGQAISANLARAVQVIRRRDISQSVEIETALPVRVIRTYITAQPMESDAASAIIRRKIKIVGLTNSTEEAEAVKVIKRYAIGRATEIDLAWSIERRVLLEAGTAKVRVEPASHATIQDVNPNSSVRVRDRRN